jgi:hypothetical protein
VTSKQITTKAELMPAIEQGWTTLQTTLSRLNEQQLTTLHDAHGWSVKDHLIHLLYWERSALFFLLSKARHEGLAVDEAVYLSEDEDAINAVIFYKHKEMPLAEALTGLKEIHQQLMTALQPLTDVDLQKRYRAYLPDEPGDGDGPPAINVIFGNSGHHFGEHLAWIKVLANADRI